MPGHSRSKNGVASLAYVPGIHALLVCETKDVDGRDNVREDGAARLMPGHDARRAFANLCSCEFDFWSGRRNDSRVSH